MAVEGHVFTATASDEQGFWPHPGLFRLFFPVDHLGQLKGQHLLGGIELAASQFSMASISSMGMKVSSFMQLMTSASSTLRQYWKKS